MKEFILVEFLVKDEDYLDFLNTLADLGNDFELLKSDTEYDTGLGSTTAFHTFYRISGKMNSMTASMFKLKHQEAMRISYIPEDLKDKYRK